MRVLAFGEILWDIFLHEDRKEIGGAPFNFAAHMARMGAESSIASALGADTLGVQALKKAEEFGVASEYISVTDKPTGYCEVTLKDGKPSYRLAENVAYDYIPKQSIKGKYDALYMGTLAQRNRASRETLSTLIRETEVRETFFDINIRPPFYTRAVLEQSLGQASILKLSREEKDFLSVLGIPESNTEQLCLRLKQEYPLKYILITMDKDGAALFDCTGERFIYSKKPTGRVISTVGAGDSFSACFLYNYMNGRDLRQCLERAVTLSDYVVTRLGAVPEYGCELLKEITE